MLQGLSNVEGGRAALPFVSIFYGAPSQYLWEDDSGTVHTIDQGESGEQEDALMPLLYSVGQHGALHKLHSEELRDEETLLAFLDDTYVVIPCPDRTTTVYAALQEAMFSTTGIRINPGKTKIWNAAGVKPSGCGVLQRIAETYDPTAVVWRGSELPTHRQGLNVLGTPLGHPDFVRTSLEMKNISHQCFLDRIPLLEDVQASWLLLVHCAAARANYMTRVVEPGATRDFSERNDEALWQCLCQIMRISPTQAEDIRLTATLPMVLGGLGLRSATRVRQAAYWSSWADCLPMVHHRHPMVAATLVAQLSGNPETRCLSAVREAKHELAIAGFESPSWQAIACGARPARREPEDHEPGTVRRGWQHEAASVVEERAREAMFTRVSDQVKALVRSQGGPGAGAPFTATPTCRETTIPSHLFRVLLLRRLRQQLPLAGRACRCGRLLDSFGHHRAACPRAGVLSRRGFSLESAAARICREAGGRVRTNAFVRDLDVPDANAGDGRRLEVVVDGLPLFGGWQLAVDTTLVCALHGDGRPRRGAAEMDGVALLTARRVKERRYPEFVGVQARARLVVLAVEVGGRFSKETNGFLTGLAKARARSETPLMQRRVEQAWRMRWSWLLGCAAAKAVAASLLEMQGCVGTDGASPAGHEVEGDFRYAGLAA